MMGEEAYEYDDEDNIDGDVDLEETPSRMVYTITCLDGQIMRWEDCLVIRIPYLEHELPGRTKGRR